MKTYLKLIFATILAAALTACSSEKNESNNDSDNSEKSSAGTETGNKFYDAAVKKIHTGPTGVTIIEAKSIVDHMILDGTIGLGEINSMDLSDPSKNSDRLNRSLAEAQKAVIQE